MYEEKSTRAGKHLPEKKPRVYSNKYAAKHARKWRENHPEACSRPGCKRQLVEGIGLCLYHKEKHYELMRRVKSERKIRVLSHYGPMGNLQCCWSGCEVVDPDMLSLDHVNNDGAIARKSGYDGCGDGLYRKVERDKFPEGYQTLCHNHQWKKEILRRK